MNKTVRNLDTGSYQPISQPAVRLPEAFDVDAGANRRVSALLAGVGDQAVPDAGMKAAEAALARFVEREKHSDAEWAGQVAQEYGLLRD